MGNIYSFGANKRLEAINGVRTHADSDHVVVSENGTSSLRENPNSIDQSSAPAPSSPIKGPTF